MADRFFNFPVQLMQSAPNMHVFGDNVMDYCIYKHSLTLEGAAEKKMKDAAKYFGITLGNISRSLRNGREVYENMPSAPAMTGINTNTLFEFYEGNQSDFDIVTLMAFLAIKSILGKKSFTRITNEYLLCRMAGYDSKNECNELPEYLTPWCKRRGLNRIKLELQKSYGLKIYARYTKGFFVSFSLSLDELIEVVETKRKKYYETHLRDQQNAAVLRVLTKLYPDAAR